MPLDQLPRLWRTLKRLQPSQLWWRTRYLVERKWPASWQAGWPFAGSSVGHSADLLLSENFPAVPLFHRSAAGPEVVSDLAYGRFDHLQKTVVITPDAPDWKTGGQAAGRLWQITWHYHEWVFTLAEAASQGDSRALPVLIHYLEDWFARCRLSDVGRGHLSWNAFAIATRLSWWIRAWQTLGTSRLSAHPAFVKQWRESLVEQARYLATHLEWDLRANHLLRDAVGLAWAGRFFEGDEPTAWLKIATEIAVSQAREQVCRDGGHFERSPMYHVHVMEDFLTLALLLKDPQAVRELTATWQRMADYLVWMRHPDGELPLFNDAAMQHVCEPARMLELGSALRIPVECELPAGGKVFPETGVAVWHGDPFSLFFDIGPIGPDCQPGHAHADNLTLEISCGGERLIVDPGVYHYDNDARRREDRSTAAHNTVCVNNQDSSEVWHIFRVGRRAEALLLHADLQPQGMNVSANHTGYAHLPGEPIHRRTVEVKSQQLTIIDSVDGTGMQQLSGGWLIDPRWQVESLEAGWKLQSGEQTVVVQVTVNQAVTLGSTESNYHPQFGMELPTTRLVWSTVTQLPFDLQTTFELVASPQAVLPATRQQALLTTNH